MSKIRIVNGPYRGRERTLADASLTIGRDAEAGIQILDRSASRFHAEIFPVGGMWFVRDLESKNGTYVNDEKIGDEELLREGDVIKIGSTELIFESGQALGEEDSSSRISYRDDPELLTKTSEFRLDELSDIAEPKEPDTDSARSLRLLYQIARMLSDGPHGPDKEVRLLDALIQALPAECALIFRREGPSGRLVPAVVRTAAPAIQPVISRSIIRKTFAENKALHTANAQTDERFDRHASVIQRGVRSVICVPLAVGGQVKGVVYLGRGEGAAPFEPIDLELVSGVTLQLGMAMHASEQERRHRIGLWRTTKALMRALEERAGCAGSGERVARFASALAGSLKLDARAKERLAQAGLMHQVSRLGSGGPEGLMSTLEGLEDFEDVIAVVRGAETLGEDADTESQVLAVARAFEQATRSDPGADVPAIIERLKVDPRLDGQVVAALQGCHLDGSLYAGPGSGGSGSGGAA